MKVRSKLDAYIFLFAIFAIFAAGLSQFGCSNVKGFQYASDGPLTAGEARNAALMAQAEADALNRIAEGNDRQATSFVNAAKSIADQVGAPAAVGTAIGALSTLWVPPPGRRKKKEQAASKE